MRRASERPPPKETGPIVTKFNIKLRPIPGQYDAKGREVQTVVAVPLDLPIERPVLDLAA